MKKNNFRKAVLRKLINLWPPFIGAGIRVKKISKDFRSITVEMKLRKWNLNIMGTHFGGSIYAMTDPFYMMILMENLGDDYIVWDKAANIRFKKPGKGKITARFNISAKELAEIKKKADTQHKVEPKFKVEIRDEAGDVVAEVDKLLYVRKKKKTLKK